MAASRSRTAMATWSISVSSPDVVISQLPSSVALEQGDLVLAVGGALLRAGDAQARARREAPDGQLAVRLVLVAALRGVADLLEVVGRRHDRLDPALGDEAVHVPRLLVVREVRRHDPLQLHPEGAVVVLDHEPRRRRTGDDRAAALGDEDGGAEGGSAGVLEHDAR